MMIAIAVAASLVAYAWIMGYLNFTTTKVGKAIQIQSLATDAANPNILLVYVQNVGKGAVEFDPVNCAYVNDQRGTIASININPLIEGQTATINVDLTGMSIDLDELIKVKVVIKDGTFSEIRSTVPVGSLPSAYTLTVTWDPLAGGDVTTDIPPPYAPGVTVQLTANPEDGWSFSSWGGDLLGSTNNPETIVMDGNKAVSATFTQDQYTVGLDVDGSGSATIDPDQATYTYGTIVQLDATPSGSWSFGGWSSDTLNIVIDEPSLASTSATINGAGTIKATFTLNHYQITVTGSPAGAIGGTFKVTYTKDGTPHTNEPQATTWTETVDGATTVTVSDPQSPITVGTTQYVFNSYSPSASVSMDAAKIITINYQTQYYLTVNSAHGTTSGQGWYNSGVTAYAGLSSGTVSGGTGIQYVFTSWGTDASGTDYAQSNGIAMSGPKTATANWQTQYYLTVTSVRDSPNPTSRWYNSGTSVTASVTSPADESGGTRYRCTGWTGTGSVQSSGTTTSTTFTITAPSTITWNWQTQYYLTVSSTYGTTGGQGWYDSSTTAYATVTPLTVPGPTDTQYVFTQWSGGTSGTTSPSNPITMNAPKTATANWKTQYRVQFAANPPAGGTTTPSTPTWYDAGVGGNTISASPAGGYTFSSWSASPPGSVTFADPVSSSTNHITVNSAGTITATFTVVRLPIYVSTANQVHDIPNVGSHSSFPNMQNDGSYDTLTEANTGGGESWVSPTGDSGSSWSNRGNARDGNTGTYAEDDIGDDSWSDWLVLSYSPTTGTKIRYWVTRESSDINTMQIEVYNTGTSNWESVFNGNPTTTGQWVNVTFASKTTNQMRLRFYNDHWSSNRWARVYETAVLSVAPPNYQLDLEVQFSGVTDYSYYTQLEIKTGTLNAENLAVYYWSGGSWQLLTSALSANTVNTFTVSLSGPTFELRFIDTTGTGDTTQSTWQIDYVRLVAP
jgi:hypothetical protein